MRLHASVVAVGWFGFVSVVGLHPAIAVGSFSLSTPANGGWVNGTPTLTWAAASAATSYTLTITPVTGTPLVKTGLTTTSYTLLAGEALAAASGPYSWRVTAYDATSASADSGSWSFFVDTSPPSDFALTGPEPNAWTKSGRAQVVWNPSSDAGSGIAQYHVYVDGVLCADAPSTSTGASLSASSCSPGEGTHYWAVSVEDAVGNVTWCTDAPGGSPGRAFQIDNTGPFDPAVTGGVFGVASSQVPDNKMLDTGLTLLPGEEIHVTASGTWCFLGCTSSIGCTGPNGSSSLGNVFPADNCEAQQLIAEVNGDFYCLGSNRILTTPGGRLYLGGNAQDGSCSTPTITVTVTGGHGFDLLSPAQAAVLAEQRPTFSWNAASDQGSGGVTYHLTVDDTLVTTSETSAALTNALADGLHSWVVVARDAVDNRTSSVTRSFRVDTTRPEEFRLSSPANDACTSVPTPSFCWSNAADDSGVATSQLWIDGVLASAAGSCTTPDAPLAQGIHSWYAVQIDRVGNARQSTDTRQLRVDYTPPPAPTLLAPTHGSSTVDPPVFSWSAAADNLGIESYQVYVDGTLKATVSGSTLSWMATTEIAPGSHSWYVRALDYCAQTADSETFAFAAEACVPDGTEHTCPGYTLGRCRPGTRTCTAAGTWSSCSGAVAPARETCNGEDDDCDGVVDNGNTNFCGGACPLTSAICDGDDLDLCQEGLTTCAGLNELKCSETTPNNVEVCNGRDDDCNGVVDDSPVCTGTLPIGGAGGAGNAGAGAGGAIGAGSGGAIGTGAASTGGATGTGAAASTGGITGTAGSGTGDAVGTGGTIQASTGGATTAGGPGTGGGGTLHTGGTTAHDGGLDAGPIPDSATGDDASTTGGNATTQDSGTPSSNDGSTNRGGAQSSDGAVAGTPASGASPINDNSVLPDEGCSCRVAQPRSGGWSALCLLLGLVLLRRRR